MSSLNSTLVFIQRQIIQYVCSTYLVFGVIGCCLNIILFTRRKLLKISCCIYFMMASIPMLISLVLGVIPYIYSIDHANLFTTIAAFCKARGYLLQSCSMMYRWFLVAACFNRYVLTSESARLRKFTKIYITYRVIAVIMIVWLILPAQVLIFFNLRGGKCGVVYDTGVSLYFSIYTIVTGNILPVSIMFICSILIRRNLVLKRQRRCQLTVNENARRRRDQQIFAMLLFQVLVYFVTQTPWMLLYFYTAATIYISNRSADRIAIEQFITFMADITVFLLPALSFYLYTLASRTFRHELMKLLRYPVRCCWRNNTNRINPLIANIPLRTTMEQVPTAVYS